MSALSRIADQRLAIGMNRRLILPQRIVPETEILIGFGIFRIDAESGACLGDRVRAVVQSIEQIGQRTVILCQIGHQPQGQFQFIVRVVQIVLLAKHLRQEQSAGPDSSIAGESLHATRFRLR